MARIMAIDYGGKRTGLAVTDPMQIIATGLTTVHTKDLMDYIKAYTIDEEVECFVVGEPKNLDNSPSQSAEMVNNFVKFLKRTFPDKLVEQVDERFTSKIAARTMATQGLKKKDRQRKENLDMMSATLILQTYMEKSAL